MPSSIPSSHSPFESGREPVGIVLAAGLGARLKPLTEHWPKPALPFLNRPLMTYGLDVLARAGIRRIGINTFHRADQVVRVARDWLAAQRDPTIDLVFSRESVLMGTGGGARGVWGALGRPTGPVVVLNGDIVTAFDLSAHVQEHERRGAAATLVVNRGGEGRVFLDESGERVVQLPGSAGPVRVASGDDEVSFTGASILEPEAVLELPAEPGCLIREGLSKRLLAAGEVRASVSEGRHTDVGTPSRYWTATVHSLDRAGSVVDIDVPQGSAIRPPVQIAGDTVLEGPVELGPYLVLGGGTRVASGTLARSGVAYAARIKGDFEGRLVVQDVELLLA